MASASPAFRADSIVVHWQLLTSWPVLLHLRLLLLACLALAASGQASHACEAEVNSACPERAGSELAGCLKDKSEHDTPTEISSECADFIAVNVACAEDIAKFCDDAFFSADTARCLTEWTDERNLDQKCAGVLKWAVPKKEDTRTDELGMSEQDYAEKREWQAKRREARSASIEKIKEDKKQEEEMETLKREDPQAYKQMMKEKEEAKRSFEELKKRKRLMAAAEERKRKAESGEQDEEDEKERQRQRRGGRKTQESSSPWWIPYALGGCGVAFIAATILNKLTEKKEEDEDEKED